MVKGVAVRFSSYEETIPKVLKLIKLDKELKKHNKIVIKPNLVTDFPELSSKPEFIEPILKFCIHHKNPDAEIFIAEGCDGADTEDIFHEYGFSKLAEKYAVGLIDLNYADTHEVNKDFLKFQSIYYPQILLDSFVISAPRLVKNDEIAIASSLSNMLGAYPAKHYKGFFSSTKNKLSKYPVKYQIHDILKCKTPELAVIDSSENGFLLIGQPLEMDKQAAKSIGINWKNISYLNLIEESFSQASTQEVNEAAETK